MFLSLRKEIISVMRHDPAASSVLEVLLTCSGLHALMMYRLAHFLYRHRFRLVARIISQWAKFLTGIEIHPGARIGQGVFIDHGAGVVIGQTAVIGNNVVIYQGVTLGGNGKDRGKRHPTIEDGVMISAGAKVLGAFTVGQNAKIGAGSVVLAEVPPNATIVGIPGRVVRLNGVRVDNLDQALPDPLSDEIERLTTLVDQLTQRLATLEQRLADSDATTPLS